MQNDFGDVRRSGRAPCSRQGVEAGNGRVLAVLLALIGMLSIGKGIYTEWLWFGTSRLIRASSPKILGTRLALCCRVSFVFAALFAGNIILAARLSHEQGA